MSYIHVSPIGKQKKRRNTKRMCPGIQDLWLVSQKLNPFHYHIYSKPKYLYTLVGIQVRFLIGDDTKVKASPALHLTTSSGNLFSSWDTGHIFFKITKDGYNQLPIILYTLAVSPSLGGSRQHKRNNKKPASYN